MTRDEILARLKATPNVGQVKHEDFIDYVVVIKGTKNEGTKERPKWVTVENPYMTVNGKNAMAVQDAAAQNVRIDIRTDILHLDEKQVTLRATIEAPHGTAQGIASSSFTGARGAEDSNPWEVAETSAIGRALSTLGYGLIPGAGRASAEDMQRATARPKQGPFPKRTSSTRCWKAGR
jgi:hypothetical protein